MRAASRTSSSPSWPSSASWGSRSPRSTAARAATRSPYAIAIEELTRIDSSVAITVAAHTSLGTMPILLFGTEEQKRALAPATSRRGERLAAFGLTEPDAGSDAGATRTTADLRDGSVGRQRLEALHHERRAPTSRRASRSRPCTGEDEISNLVVENGTPGLRDLRADEEARLARVRHAELSFDDCAVPGGQPPRRRAARASGSSSRSSTAAGSRSPRWASASRRARTTSPTRTRRSASSSASRSRRSRRSGSSSPTWRPRSRRRAALVCKAAWLKDQGRPFAREAAMAKLYTGELSNRVANASLQIHGGYGYMEEFADLAPLPRPEDPRDRRGHERGAADGHRSPSRPAVRARSSFSRCLILAAVGRGACHDRRRRSSSEESTTDDRASTCRTSVAPHATTALRVTAPRRARDRARAPGSEGWSATVDGSTATWSGGRISRARRPRRSAADPGATAEAGTYAFSASSATTTADVGGLAPLSVLTVHAGAAETRRSTSWRARSSAARRRARRDRRQRRRPASLRRRSLQEK